MRDYGVLIENSITRWSVMSYFAIIRHDIRLFLVTEIILNKDRY